MNKKIIFVLLFVFLISLNSALSNECEDYSCDDFDYDEDDVEEISCAIKAECPLTNEQYVLALDKQSYVLSEHVNLSDESQREELVKWLTFYGDILRKNKDFYNLDSGLVSKIHRSYVNYFDWLFFGHSYNDTDILLLNYALNTSEDLINNNSQDFIKTRVVNNNTNLFYYYVINVNNLSFKEMQSRIASYDFHQFEPEKNIFYTQGDDSVSFSIDDLIFLTNIGFSDFYIGSTGLLGALKYNGDDLDETRKVYYSSEGLVFEGKSLVLPDNVILLEGVAILRKEGIVFRDNSYFELNNFSFKTDKDLILKRQPCESESISCVEFLKQEERDVFVISLKNDAHIEIREKQPVNVVYSLDFITDSSSLFLEQFGDSGKTEFVFSEDKYSIKGNPVNDIYFGKQYDNKICNVYISKDAVIDCENDLYSGDESIAFSALLRQKILDAVRYNRENIDKHKVGNFRGSKLGSIGLSNDADGQVNSWVAYATSNLNSKNKPCRSFSDCKSFYSRLSSEGFSNEEKISFFIGIKTGMSLIEAKNFAKNYDDVSNILSDVNMASYVYDFENSRLLSPASVNEQEKYDSVVSLVGSFDVETFAKAYDFAKDELKDVNVAEKYILKTSNCGVFVHDIIERTYSEMCMPDKGKEVQTSSYSFKNNYVDSIFYMVIYYVTYHDWDLLLFDPDTSNRGGGGWVGPKDSFRLDGEGNMHINTLLFATKTTDKTVVVDKYIKNYYRNRNDPQLMDLASLIGSRAGIVSFNSGYHAAFMLAENGDIYIVDMNWLSTENNPDGLNKRLLAEDIPNTRGGLAAFPPGTLK